MSVKLQQAFDARAVKPSDPDGRGGFPVGGVPSMIIQTELKENSDKTSGHHALLTLQGLDGPAKGATALWRLNLFHQKSPEAVKIAYEQLSALGWVTGVFNITDLDELVNKPFIAIVESQNNPQYPNSTEIKGVLDYNGDKPGQPGVKGRIPVPGPAPEAAASGKPWTPGGAAAANTPAAAATTFGPASTTQQQPPQQPAQGFAPAGTPTVTAPVPNAWAPAQAPGTVPVQQPAQQQAPAGNVPSWATPR